MADYRIDDLARAAGTTVRNVRAYQEKGLLPAPKKTGRVALYGEHHLERLRILTDLLARGYTQANIAEMLAASRQHQGVGELILAVAKKDGTGPEALGRARELAGPWSDEPAVALPVAELIARFGAASPATIQRAIELGIFAVADGDKVSVKSRRLLDAGSALAQVGVPLGAILDALVRLRAGLDELAQLMVDLVAEPVTRAVGFAEGAPLTSERVRDAAEQIRVLRHEAEVVVRLELERALERHTLRRVAELVSASLL